MEGQSRRDVFRIVAGAVAAGPLAAQSAAGAPLFFTPTEFQILDELAEIIIPADDHSPGARAAKVAAYIDKTMAESFDKEPPRMFREGLKTVDGLSREMHGKAFLEATPKERVAVVARMARNEKKPQKPEEKFFGELKGSVVFAYYTSSIGIHQEMDYKGNTVQTEFSGFDADLVPLHPPESTK